jgi:hypothetical protein
MLNCRWRSTAARGDSTGWNRAKMDFLMSRWRMHGWVVLSFLFLVVGRDSQIRLHPRLGYEEDRIPQRADLNCHLTPSSICLAIGFSFAATSALLSLRLVARARTVLFAAFAVGAAYTALALPILDRFY